MPLKTLKELQSAVKTLGPTAPYTLQVLDAVASQWLTPYDWYQTAKATLAPRDFILWRTEYEERARKLVQERSSSRNGAKPTVPMLLGQKNSRESTKRSQNKGGLTVLYFKTRKCPYSLHCR